jgi:hypothetical protein
MRKIAISCVLLLTLPFAARAFAQSDQQAPSKAPEAAKAPEPPAHYYHLDLVVKEIGEDGKPTNSRTYSCTVSTARNERDQVRIGSRVPIATGSFMTNSANAQVNTQFQYQDVGVSFDVSDVREVGNKLAMDLHAAISGVGANVRFGGENGITEPIVRQNVWQAPVLISTGKPTVVFTSDDTDSKGGMQVVVTATPLE